MSKITIKFQVIGVDPDDYSEECFEEFDLYEEAEKFIQETNYVAKYFKIEKVFIKED